MTKFRAISVETGKEVYGVGVSPSTETNLFGKTFKEGEVSYLFSEGTMEWIDGCEFCYCQGFNFVYNQWMSELRYFFGRKHMKL